MTREESATNLRSYVQICYSVGDHAPLLAIGELKLLLDRPPAFHPYRPIVAGEAFVRHWLEIASRPHPFEIPFLRNHPLWEEYRKRILPFRTDAASLEDFREATRLPPETIPERNAADCWDYLVRRIRDYLDCDGILPAVVGNSEKEAVALAFKFVPRQEGKLRIIDSAGKVFDHWSGELGHLENYFHLMDVQIRCVRGKIAEEGRSLALPLFLASWKKILGNYSPLAILATGDIAADPLMSIVSVEGVEQKKLLARKMGALFICPGIEKGKELLNITAGIGLGEATEIVRDVLINNQLIKPDLRTIEKAVESINSKIHWGWIGLVAAQNQIRELEKQLKLLATTDPEARACRDGLVESLRISEAAILLHSGRTEEAGRIFQDIEKRPERRFSFDYIKSVALQVVYLTDRGMLDEAEELGRKNLRNARNQENEVSREVFLKSLMYASGNLGGQALLQIALRDRDPERKRESLKLLEEGLRRGEALYKREETVEYKMELTRCRSQVFQWYATLEPAEAEIDFQKAEEDFQRLLRPGDEYDSSLDFAKRHRFFAAYRRFLSGDLPIGKFEEYELPYGFAWLEALSKKYRGALYAAAGRYRDAAADFQDALRILKRPEDPLDWFMGGTAALQAGESLSPFDPDRSREYLKEANRVFSAEYFREWFPGKLSPARWQERIAGLLEGRAPGELCHPQQFFIY